MRGVEPHQNSSGGFFKKVERPRSVGGFIRNRNIIFVDVNALLNPRTTTMDKYWYEINRPIKESLLDLVPEDEIVVVITKESFEDYFSFPDISHGVNSFLIGNGFSNIVACESVSSFHQKFEEICIKKSCSLDDVLGVAADKRVAPYFDGKMKFIYPDSRVGELNPVDLEAATTQCLDGKFVLCLDIDDTLIFLAKTIAEGKPMLNPFVLEYIEKLYKAGHKFDVYFVTARSNIKHAYCSLKEAGCANHQEYKRISDLSSSLECVEAAFKEAIKPFLGVNFIGTRHSGPDLSTAPVVRSNPDLFAKYFILRQVSRVHGYPVLFIDNNRNEINDVRAKGSFGGQIVCVECFDQCVLSYEQEDKMAAHLGYSTVRPKTV